MAKRPKVRARRKYKNIHQDNCSQGIENTTDGIDSNDDRDTEQTRRQRSGKTGPRKQGLSKKEKRLAQYIGEGFQRIEEKDGPNIDVKARKAKRTRKIHARGTDVVEALLHVETNINGALTKEWAFRAGSDDHLYRNAAQNYKKLARHLANRTHSGEKFDLPRSGVSRTADSVVLQHAWKTAAGAPLTVSIPCMNNQNKDSKGPDRQLNQQECQGIERLTGYDPNELVHEYLQSFSSDNDAQDGPA